MRKIKAFGGCLATVLAVLSLVNLFPNLSGTQWTAALVIMFLLTSVTIKLLK